MKKFFAILFAVVASLACAMTAAGCNKDSGKLKVFVPDGAPALAVAGINDTEAGGYFDVSVVDAGNINAYVSGNMEADIAVMPVNAAVKLLGSGEKYKMIGTVTHGNLYLMKKEGGQDISATADLKSLVGKTVGVINLTNVPGLTFKVILNDNQLEFNELKDGASAQADKVNLLNVTPQDVVPATADCDYFVVPEPVATTKANATGGKLSFAGDLQALYGGDRGYPQAVAVAKNTVIENHLDAVNAFVTSFGHTENWIASENTSSQDILGAIDKMTKGDLSHMFTADNLTKTVIAHCGIRFEMNETGNKAEVLLFMEKLNAISNNAWGTPDYEKFFY